MGARLILVALTALCLSVQAAPIPKRAEQYIQQLVDAQKLLWPNAPSAHFIAGQIEQESCITLNHTYCWNPNAKLQTSREHGVGLGQFTRAYNKDGSIRFDVIDDLSKRHPELDGWNWDTRHEAEYQLKAIILMDKGIYDRVKGAASVTDRLAFTLSAYNGGEGGLRVDRRLCSNTPGCDPAKWKGNVEKTSTKSKVPHPQYKKSFFQINREYVTNVLDKRGPKYAPYFKDPH